MDYGMVGGIVFGGCLLVGLIIGLMGRIVWAITPPLAMIFLGVLTGAVATRSTPLQFVVAYVVCALSLGIGYMMGAWFHAREERRPK